MEEDKNNTNKNKLFIFIICLAIVLALLIFYKIYNADGGEPRVKLSNIFDLNYWTFKFTGLVLLITGIKIIIKRFIASKK